MRATVLLFDVDGTLISTGGAGRRALERAFAQAHGRQDAIENVRLDGMTDHAIVRQALARIGAEFSTAALEDVLAAYLIFLADEVGKVPDEKYVVHRGTREALRAALATPNLALGLGTGNIKEGARIKLERAGLHSHFSFGGYGSDAESRPELIRRGAERGAALLNQPLEECRVVIIGDTPKDIDAARTIGAECLAVGTGSFAVAALKAAGAHHAFDHLGAEGALTALLGS